MSRPRDEWRCAGTDERRGAQRGRIGMSTRKIRDMAKVMTVGTMQRLSVVTAGPAHAYHSLG
jgi:hypothetical protein